MALSAGNSTGELCPGLKRWPSRRAVIGLVWGLDSIGCWLWQEPSADEGLMRANLCFITPCKRVHVGSSESQHFPRKQKQIRLVINLTYVWFSLAFFSSYFNTDTSQLELEIQFFNHSCLDLKLCGIQLYFPASFMTVTKKHLNN